MKTLLDLCHEFGIELSSRGRGRCPFHGGDNPTAFSVQSYQNGKYRFKCFNCGASGDAITFYMGATGCDFLTAKKYVEGDSNPSRYIQPKKPLFKIPDKPNHEYDIECNDCIRELYHFIGWLRKYAQNLFMSGEDDKGWEILQEASNYKTQLLNLESELS